MRLIFVRHAESVNNVIAKHINRSTHFENGRKSWLTNRKADPKLSQGGRLQAELLSNHVHEVLSKMTRGEPKVLIYTSPMMRALETAEALGKALKGAEIHVDDNLHEIGGIYAGEYKTGVSRTVEALKEDFPEFDFSALAKSSGVWYTKGFESRGQAIERAAKYAERFRSEEFQEEMGGNVAVFIVSHAEFLDLVLQELLQIPPSVSVDLGKRYLDSSKDEKQRPHVFRLKNSSYSQVDIRGKEVKVQFINRLSQEMVI